MPKPTMAFLRSLGLDNGHDIAKTGPGPQVYLYYTPYSRLQPAGPCWRVAHIGFRTDPKSAWYNEGDKAFVPFARGKEDALDAAKAWASERYGITEWERSGYGSHHPAGTIAAAVDAARAIRA